MEVYFKDIVDAPKRTLAKDLRVDGNRAPKGIILLRAMNPFEYEMSI